MTHRHRWGRRALATALAAFALATVWSPVQAASSLSGYSYIDRNNDGQLAFADAAQPEWVLSGVEVKLCALAAGHVLYDNRQGFSVPDVVWETFKRQSLP